MLKSLYIKNYALIEETRAEFSDYFSVITGETGAGKSILLGALGLITGKRSDSSSIGNPDKKCIVEAEFVLSDSLKLLFESNDLDFETQTIIRREISADGKSRAFVNDSPVNVNVLKELSSKIIDIHSQHDVYTLADPAFRLNVADVFAGNQERLDVYQKQYRFWQGKIKELKDLKEAEAKGKADYDYIKFRFEELENADLREGELEELEEEINLLTHSEEIKSSLNAASLLLYEDEQNITGMLASLKTVLQKSASYNPAIENYLERINSCSVELKELYAEISGLSDKIHFDPERATEAEERISLLYKLLKKYAKQSVSELVLLRNELEQSLLVVDSAESQIQQLELEIEQIYSELLAKAVEISQKRKKGAEIFEKKSIEILHELEMPDADLKVQFSDLSELSLYGKDEIKFMFRANKGHDMNELQKTASGGEMSRVMLAVKSVLAELKELPTVIFDEIDTGISGKTADKVGNIMKLLSKRIQVIAITHLPQIAGKGDYHIKVLKDNSSEKAVSKLEVLTHESRIVEIASMLSGSTVTKEALAHAESLLKG